MRIRAALISDLILRLLLRRRIRLPWTTKSKINMPIAGLIELIRDPPTTYSSSHPPRSRIAAIYLDLHPPSHRLTPRRAAHSLRLMASSSESGRPEQGSRASGKVFGGSAGWPSTLAPPNAYVRDEPGIEAESDAFIFSRQEHTTEPLGKTRRE